MLPAWRAEDEHYAAYITRPAIANERLTLNRAGDVVLQLKSPYHDGTTHVVMSPLELMQRLAALVPRPRLHLIRFPWRARAQRQPEGQDALQLGKYRTKLRSAIIPSAPVNAPNAAAVHPVPPKSRASCPSGSRRRTPSLGAGAPELCPVAQAGIRYRHRAVSASSGGTLTIIAAIEDPPVIDKILTHLGLSARAPPRSPARSFDRLQMT